MTTNKLFSKNTQAIFWNNNTKAIQRMLDYDYTIQRETPSVAAIVHSTSNSSFQKFFLGSIEVIIPVYQSTSEACKKHKKANVFINFASYRSAYEISNQALCEESIDTVMITAEGIPERLARILNQKAQGLGKVVIGPSTVGAISPGAFKIANIGGAIKNIVESKMHRAGSAGLVTRSGGLFNELANIIARNADGIAEGVATGGDRFVGSKFIDHLLRMEKNPEIKYTVLLGEVGGTDEYEVIEAVKDGRIKKPMIAWCIGTIAKFFDRGVQFGHAGAKANVDEEQADAKNSAMRAVGIMVPENFNCMPEAIRDIYQQLSVDGHITRIPRSTVPLLPQDFEELSRDKTVRRATNFICTISDDRGDEASYAGYPISSLATPETGFSIGDVITLLWFKKRYPKWATQFLETVLKTVADHGPAVSGAHNAKVTARAGKDVISSLVTGLLTIGPRFGGAIDSAAEHFKYGFDHKLSPKKFVQHMKSKGIPIPGIGHRVKSRTNPDKRVEGLKKYALEHFPKTDFLAYGLSIEEVTSGKKENLILNVDGTIGLLMLDMWKALGYSNDELDEFINSGSLNAFFILGRSIGFIGHILDEKRLKMPMYRQPYDEILYETEEQIHF